MRKEQQMATRNVGENGGGHGILGGRSIQDFVPGLSNFNLSNINLSSEDLDRYRQQARDIDEQARLFIRENPVAVVAGAVCLGFVVGRLLSR